MNEKKNEIEEKYRDFFVQEAAKVIVLMRAGLVELEEKRDDTAVCAEIERLAHNMKSSTAMMGYEDLRKMCAAMEELLDRMEAKKLSAGDDVLRVLKDCVQALDESVRSIGETGSEGSCPWHAVYSLRQLLGDEQCDHA